LNEPRQSNKKPANDHSGWRGIIQSVKSPLGIFTLALLIAESIMGTTVVAVGGIDRTILIVGMISTILAIIVTVTLLALYAPEPLIGKPVNLPESNIHVFDTDPKINDYMLKLVSSGSTLDIVAGGLSWVKSDDRIKRTLIDRSQKGEVNIYMPTTNDVAKELKRKGARIKLSPKLADQQFAHFTLVDKANPGQAKLAVSCGTIPKLLVSEFSEQTNSQIMTLVQNYLSIF
jgi:hypothetical protein